MLVVEIKYKKRSDSVTDKYYFKDMLCLETSATVIEVDQENSAVILDKTIFHAKGGGQPADCGTLNDIAVLNVIHSENGAILHQIANEDLHHFSINSTITMRVDPLKRKYHSRLHTAGHLLSGVVEKLYPEIKAISGNHVPGQCRVVFTGHSFPEKELFMSAIIAELKTAIKSNGAVIATNGDNNVRNISIVGFHNSPCGGTHVSALSEIGHVTIRKINIKGEQLSIGYDISD